MALYTRMVVECYDAPSLLYYLPNCLGQKIGVLHVTVQRRLPLHELRPMWPQSALLPCIKGRKESGGVGASKQLETYILPTPHLPQLVHNRTTAYRVPS